VRLRIRLPLRLQAAVWTSKEPLEAYSFSKASAWLAVVYSTSVRHFSFATRDTANLSLQCTFDKLQNGMTYAHPQSVYVSAQT
jgi:hypothetical protein